MWSSWISAFRLRTLPLSLSCISMGAFLAASEGHFRLSVFSLCCLTTVLLQILSNLANDYGDSIHGADHAGRSGPSRAVQSGAIPARSMRNAVILFSLLSLVSGLALLWIALGTNWQAVSYFLLMGVACIIAAITYTVGKKPYGYAGLGDFSVLIFFGLVGVLGSLYLFTGNVKWPDVLPALSCGFFAMAVLNVNNIRDIDSDLHAGKFSVPVRIGKKKATAYHWFLLVGGQMAAIVYTWLQYESVYQLLFLLTLPLFIINGLAVTRKSSAELDPYLKQMALSTLLFVVFFGLGIIL
ncbi:MAG: 1,4-dihydroxy-2-naphthoate polyprenyltransferase [Bacteroidetes bacterium]|nr:1,4-dihydroxy-2-naphthoate polyprenyltransferase [Bacteroidota bacterium]